jgi:hypothetical protein
VNDWCIRDFFDVVQLCAIEQVIGIHANFVCVGSHECAREKSLRKLRGIVTLDGVEQRHRNFCSARNVIQRQTSPLARRQELMPDFHASAASKIIASQYQRLTDERWS